MEANAYVTLYTKKALGNAVTLGDNDTCVFIKQSAAEVMTSSDTVPFFTLIHM